MTLPQYLCDSFNLTREQSMALVEKYARARFDEFITGKITSGDLLSTFINIDELITNERCFLTAHTALASRVALQEAERRLKLAMFLAGTGGGLFP